MLVLAARACQAYFQFQPGQPGENSLNNLNADAGARARFALDQRLPRLFTVFDFQQAQSNFVEFVDSQLLQQSFQRGWLAFEQKFEVFVRSDFECFQLLLQTRHVHDADRNARTLEDIAIAAAALQHLALAFAQAHQRDQWQDRQQQADQTLADQRRKQLAAGLVGIEQATQLPVAVTQWLKQNGIGKTAVRLVGGRRFTEENPLGLALLQAPDMLKVLSWLACQVLQGVGCHA
ncbi:hypothetical protein ALQ55_200384 [Pseudomonas savastanoi pv. savastanoi]|nr:hypothetical protein ALQ55_200384 [Pseudomonas savastanoi pv. savastanoi]